MLRDRVDPWVETPAWHLPVCWTPRVEGWFPSVSVVVGRLVSACNSLSGLALLNRCILRITASLALPVPDSSGSGWDTSPDPAAWVLPLIARFISVLVTSLSVFFLLLGGFLLEEGEDGCSSLVAGLFSSPDPPAFFFTLLSRREQRSVKSWSESSMMSQSHTWSVTSVSSYMDPYLRIIKRHLYFNIVDNMHDTSLSVRTHFIDTREKHHIYLCLHFTLLLFERNCIG